MSDVFISYSREDIAFARLLHRALRDNEFETWIDWQDIPPSTDWLAEVYEAIEQADTFLFIISPTSVESKVCNLEIAHAVENNKRLIPIVINEVEPQKVHPHLAALNWIFFREQDEFSGTVRDLIDAIETDHEWVKAHTRLQVRALEWNRKEREGGFLLRGRDLEEAEAWLSQAAGKDPQPTALQTEYILASRQAATRRQRITLGAVLAGLAVAIVLGIFAWTQRNQAVHEGQVRATAEAQAVAESKARATAQAQAEEQRRIAVEQRDTALSRQLAAQAMNHMEDQLDLSLLLSIEAVQTANTLEARSSLLIGLTYRPRLDRILHGNPPPPQYRELYPQMFRLALSPDGQIAACGNANKSILLWDLETGQPIGEPLTGHPGEVMSLAFSPDGSVLASGGAQRTVILWDVATRQPIGDPLTAPGEHVCWDCAINHHGINSLAFSPDGRTLTAGCVNEDIIRWNVTSGERIDAHLGQRLADEPSIEHPTAFSPDGSLLASGLEDETIVLYDVATGQQVKKSPPVNMVGLAGSLAFSPEGQKLAFGDSKYNVFLWDVETIQPIGAPLLGHTKGIHSLAFSPDGTTVASGSIDKRIILWDVESGKAVGEPLIGHTDWVESLAFSPDGQRLVSYDGSNNVFVWDLTARPSILGQTIEAEEQVESLLFNPLDGGRTLLSVGRRIVDSESEYVIRAWDLQRQPLGDPATLYAGADQAILSPDGQMFASQGDEYAVRLWSTETGEPNGEPIPSSWSGALTFSPDNKLMATGDLDTTGTFPVIRDRGAVSLLDVANRRPLGELLHGHTDWIGSLAFGPDSQDLASADHSGRIMLWDLTTDRPLSRTLRDRTPTEDWVMDLAFSPDGTLLAAGCGLGSKISDGYFGLWDTSSGQPLGQPIPSPSGRIESIAFSPDGQTLASASRTDAGGAVALWDVTSRQLIGQPLPSTHSNSLAFSPDGQVLASGRNRAIVLWDVSLEAWQAHACHMANRNLTPEEWVSYLGDQPYEKSCPNLP